MEKALLEQLKQQAQDSKDYVIQLRRWFHENPETAQKEIKARQMIVKEAEKAGLPYELLPIMGVIVRIDGSGEGKTVVLRADMDALPMEESEYNLKQRKVSVSKVPGAAHMCGHDSHCAMLLGAMKILAGLRDRISGTVLCCFESGEENGTGYVEMLEGLEKYPVDACFAIHVANALESGKVSVESGPRMAGGIGLEMTLHGRSGHGSRPDLAISPIIPAAEIVSQLPAILKNQLHPESAVTCGFGLFQSGTARNIIPETAKLDGTLRVFDMDAAQKAYELTRKTADALAALHNCTITYGPKFRIYAAPVVNEPEKSKLMEALLEEAWPNEKVSASTPKWFACEFFGFYMQRYPGVLAMLGIKNDELGVGAEHHNVHFDLDESVLDRGVLCHLLYVAAHCM